MHVIGSKMLQLQLPLQHVNGCTPIDVPTRGELHWPQTFP